MAQSLTRRSFVAAASTAALALAATGCAKENEMVEQEAEETAEVETADAAADPEEITGATYKDKDLDPSVDGKWVPVSCWYSCGGKCLLRAYVVDGTITRIKTDDLHEDTFEEFQNRGCVRGRSARTMIYSPDRLKYPMKRKSWMPGGGDNVNGELRGQDTWERISWDEAFDLIAEEMRRIYDTYGGSSVLFASFGRTDTGRQLLNPMGGFVPFEFCDSYGSHFIYTGDLGGYFNHGEPGGWANNDRLDLLNSEYIILQGGNPTWSATGAPTYHLWRAKEAGAQIVYVGPEYNATANVLDAKWIPLRPGTDTAFLLAVAHEMLRLDEEKGGVIDWDFLDRCTVGFDADHMPADATTDENIKDYILGKIDGVEKTPEWASEICGSSVEDIKWYAEICGMEHPVAMLHSYSASRCSGAENLPQIMETVACMGGHHGKPGHSAGAFYHFFTANDGPDLVEIGNPTPKPETGAPMPLSVPGETDDAILSTELWQAINTGKYTWFNTVVDYADGRSLIKQSEQRDIDIRMIWTADGNPLTTRSNVNEGIKAFRKVDFVITVGLVFNPTAQYSDIVLPVMTPWEGPGYEDTGAHYFAQNRESLMWTQYAIDPTYEVKSDRQIIEELARRLGLDADALFPYTPEQQHNYRIMNALVTDDDGVTKMPLVTMTQEDLDELGLIGEPQEGKITYAEMKEMGCYHVKRTEGDNLGWIAYKDFREDPENNPRASVSGKIELYCQAKADIFARLGFAKDPIPPYASFREGINTYVKSFEDWDSKKKGKYPIQVFNGHYLRRSHTMYDGCGYTREAFASPIFVNADDAAERGVQNGDWIRVWNETGEIVKQAAVIDTIMPGVMNVPHGSWPEIDKNTGISINGGTNFLHSCELGDSVLQSYNTVLADFEKYENQDILPDVERPCIKPEGIEA